MKHVFQSFEPSKVLHNYIHCFLIRRFGDGGIVSLMINKEEKERMLILTLNYMPDLLMSIN